VPGGGMFNSIPFLSTRGADFALGPDGALAFANTFTVGSHIGEGMFVVRPDGSLARVIATGDTPPGGGMLAGLSLARLAAGDAGKFAFFGGIKGGDAREAIFVTAIPAGTASATVALAPLPSSLVSQQSATLTATVSAAAGTPGGTVGFFANGISLGSTALTTGGQNGQATLTTSSMAAGPNLIVAQYSGDSSFAPGNSPAVSAFVIGFGPPPSQLTFTPGQSLVIPLTLYAPAGSNMTFTLSCSQLPANTNCSFDQNPAAPGPSGTTVQLTLRSGTGSQVPLRRPKVPLPPAGICVAALLAALVATFLIVWQRRPSWRLATCACLATLALALVISGCGVTGSGSGAAQSSGPPPGPASFTVTGTSGTTTVSTVVHVNVQ